MNYKRKPHALPRLQVEVKAHLLNTTTVINLLARVQAKNVGLSIIRCRRPNREERPSRSALVVRCFLNLRRTLHDRGSGGESPAAVFDIFASHRFIEPGLTISEEKLIYQLIPG